MWPDGVVVDAPAFDQDDSFLQCVEDFRVQYLVSELAVEALVVTVQSFNRLKKDWTRKMGEFWVRTARSPASVARFLEVVGGPVPQKWRM